MDQMDLSKEIKKYFEFKMNAQVVKFVGCSKNMFIGKFVTLYPYIRKIYRISNLSFYFMKLQEEQ